MTDRFKNYNPEVRELVLDFEEMLDRHEQHYFDVDQLEIIIDFYLESLDADMLERSVVFAEGLFPNANSIRLRRSHLLCTKEKYNEALAILQDLERQEPQNTDVLYALGALYSVKEQPRKAIQYYQKASADGYELGMVYGNIGDEYVRLGQDREAVGYYQRALKANPAEERSLYNLCESFHFLHKELQAVDFYEQFLQEHPYNKAAWHCLGLSYQGLLAYEKAIDAFEYAITIDKKFSDAYLRQSACYHELGQMSEAVSILREGLDQVDDKSTFDALIAQYYMEQGNYETARIYLKQATELDPQAGELWMSLATCCAALNDYYVSMDYIERAMKESPNEPYLLIDAARIYAHFNEEEKAIECFEEGLSLTVYNDRCWTDYADFLIDRKNYDRAIEVLQQGLTNCEESFYFNERLAVCYFLTGRRNFLFNALQACLMVSKEWTMEVLEVCPAMRLDPEVMSIINSEL